MFRVAAATIAGAILLSAGVAGSAIADTPWQLFAATVVSGAGWAAMGAVPVNAAVSPWFVRARPAALGTAYNGASFAGLIFSPLWVALISLLGFPAAATIIGAVTIVAVAVLATRYFARTPAEMGLEPDGDAVGATNNVTAPHARSLPGGALWRDFTFITLAAGAALSCSRRSG